MAAPCSVFRLPSSVFRLPSSVFRLPSSVLRLPCQYLWLAPPAAVPTLVYRLTPLLAPTLRYLGRWYLSALRRLTTEFRSTSQANQHATIFCLSCLRCQQDFGVSLIFIFSHGMDDWYCRVVGSLRIARCSTVRSCLEVAEEKARAPAWRADMQPYQQQVRPLWSGVAREHRCTTLLARDMASGLGFSQFTQFL